MLLEVESDHRLDGRSLVRVKMSELNEVVGQRSGLIASPGVEGRHELGLVDEAILECEQPEEQMICGAHVVAPIRIGRTGEGPNQRGRPGNRERKLDYWASTTSLHSSGVARPVIPIVPLSRRNKGWKCVSAGNGCQFSPRWNMNGHQLSFAIDASYGAFVGVSR
jgi:hypothetical protein